MSDRFSVKGKKVIVTGGAMGMGFDAARTFLEEGADVFVLDFSKSLPDSIMKLKEHAAGGKVDGTCVDLTQKEDRKVAFEKAVSFLGGLDVLINAAGIQYTAAALDFPMDAFAKVLETNVSALYAVSQLAGRIMTKQGSGRIINFASMNSFIGGLQVPAYAASKGGVAQITKALSNEWGPMGVRVNAVAPGYIDTPLNKDFFEKEKARAQQLLERIPAGRWGKPADVSGTLIFLASPAADYINGAIIPIDGGFLGA